jgi:predicted transcriptional regulator
VLALMNEKPALSQAAMARELGWFFGDGTSPAKSRVQRALQGLATRGLIEKKDDMWRFTRHGKRAPKVQPPDQGTMAY